MESEKVFRVTVRGRFHELSEAADRYLRAHVDEHDFLKSAYTREGTLTYDDRIDFFNLRYELRATGDGAAERVSDDALDEARTFLDVLGYGYRDLKITATDMSEMWR